MHTRAYIALKDLVHELYPELATALRIFSPKDSKDIGAEASASPCIVIYQPRLFAAGIISQFTAQVDVCAPADVRELADVLINHLAKLTIRQPKLHKSPFPVFLMENGWERCNVQFTLRVRTPDEELEPEPEPPDPEE